LDCSKKAKQVEALEASSLGNLSFDNIHTLPILQS
jgi:hypothetical protein